MLLSIRILIIIPLNGMTLNRMIFFSMTSSIMIASTMKVSIMTLR
jgi:hypothetical protein